MNYENINLNWEEVFLQESIDLEEKMISLHLEDYKKSRLRISLENNILNWSKYQSWVSTQMGCPSINPKITSSQLSQLREQAQNTFETYKNHDFWNEDLIPLQVWDDHLIVVGLAYNEKLAKIPGCIFILAEPFILTFIGEQIFSDTESSQIDQDHLSSPGLKEEPSMLDGIDFDISAPDFDFSNTTLVKLTPESNSNGIWDYLTERHDEYTFEAKKQFSAFVVLKIINHKTTVFKMDSDLEKKLKNPSLFEYDLNDESPFKRIFETGASESFNISQMHTEILDYKYICITALKRGSITVGFLVGLKSNQLAENDQTLLEDLAKESA
ncbi:MAG: hypothetical protein A2622_10435 [Bdellovibrionales bacterium RIFCSPHIGHO2_01_FULL_40_29]|nr:MAG: hypothetical protein A2622_10435 [Bdellovibrionales bacterium RIFCSPHIGHO2_01_FULL_40_29]OFZ34377.1 MAG: hypothetical protein A3D17_00700 [Bdellovibrionales bacterium RIFCSPHIGHO2_02_FULL_40_15]